MKLYITSDHIKACDYFESLKVDVGIIYDLFVFKLDDSFNISIGRHDYSGCRYTTYILDKQLIKPYSISSDIIDGILKDSLFLTGQYGSITHVCFDIKKLPGILMQKGYAKKL